MKLLITFLCIFSCTISLSQISDNFDQGKPAFNMLWIGDTNAFEINEQQLFLNAPTDQKKASIIRQYPSTNGLSIELSISLNFSPSSSNKLQLYFTEDSLLQNGYYLELGETGSDDAWHCFSLTDGQNHLEKSGIEGRFSKSSNEFKLLFILNDSIKLVSVTDNDSITEFTNPRSTIKELNFFSIVCNYTKTRATKFSFDNFNFTPVSIKVIDEQEEPENNELEEQEPQLPLDTTTSYRAKVHDLLITELLIDPTPTRFLPNAEVIEVYNYSDSSINLKNYSIKTENSHYYFQDISISSHEVILLCNENDTSLFQQYGRVIGIQLPSLTNDKFELQLLNDSSTILHQVNFDYNKHYSNKKHGGWTYELIDINQPCISTNWSFSKHQTGGSLGEVNDSGIFSVAPKIQYYQIDKDTLSVTFNEEIRTDDYYNHITKIYLEELEETLSISEQTCNQVLIDSNISLASTFGTGHLIFNEVLFNTEEDCPEFIELHNSSSEFIHADHYYLGVGTSSISPDDIIPLPNGLIIPPKSYVVLCQNIRQLKKFLNVNTSCVLIDIDVPSLLNAEGHLFLLDELGYTITQFGYSDELHNELIETEKGVSLERRNEYTDEWTSGNTAKGNASPGFVNHSFTYKKAEQIKISTNKNFFSLSQNEALEISLILDDGNYLGDIKLFTNNGLQVSSLIDNRHFSPSDIITISNELPSLSLGIYLLYFEFRHPKNGIIRKKIPLAIIE